LLLQVSFHFLSPSFVANICIIETGDLYAWGSNVWGHLGLGHINTPAQPTIVAALSLPAEGGNGSPKEKGVKVLDVVIGFNHTLFFTAPRASTIPISPAVHKFVGEEVQPYPLPDAPNVQAPKGRILHLAAFFHNFSLSLNQVWH
jgi:Regulator of chromosome condensation (RCC1) repeat